MEGFFYLGDKLKFKISPALVAALTSYLRAGIAASGALLLSGVTDYKALGWAFLAAFLGPLIKYIDPTDKAYGIKSSDANPSN